MDVVENYRFDLAVKVVVEIVRALDILGSKRRLFEYEVLFYIRLEETNEKNWQSRYKTIDRIEEMFMDEENEVEKMVAKVASQKFIEYSLESKKLEDDNSLFCFLSRYGSMNMVKWS
jgi:hypothetical protein